MRGKGDKKTAMGALGEPLHLSDDLVLTIVGIDRRYVRLKADAPQQGIDDVVRFNGASVNCVAIPVGTSLAVAERALVEATLEACRGSRCKPRAAALLGCSLKGLYNKLEGYARADELAADRSRRTGKSPAHPSDVSQARHSHSRHRVP